MRSEALLALREPVERVDGAVVGRELELVEARRRTSLCCALISQERPICVVERRLPRLRSRRGREQGAISAPVEDA